MIISGVNLKLQYCIDLYEKDYNGKFKRTEKLKTFNKSEYETMLYNLSDRVKNNYVKLVEV